MQTGCMEKSNCQALDIQACEEVTGTHSYARIYPHLLLIVHQFSEQGILYKNSYESRALHTCAGAYSSVLSPCILLRRWGDKNKR